MHIGRDKLVTVFTATVGQDFSFTYLQECVRACIADVHKLVDLWFNELRSIPSYQEGLIPTEIIKSECTLVFVQLLSQIGDLPVPAEAKTVSTKVGHSRAVKGIPLSDLLTAIRIDYRIIWDSLVAKIGTEHPEVIIASVPRLLDAVEHHSHEVTKAYNLTHRGMVQSRKDEKRLWFTRIVETNGQNHALNLRALEVLSFSQKEHFMLYSPTKTSSNTLTNLADVLAKKHINAHKFTLEDGEILVAQLTPNQQKFIEFWTLQDGHLASFGPFLGAHVIPAALRTLLTFTAKLNDANPGVTKLEDHWQLVSLSAPEDASFLLQHQYLRELLKLPKADRKALIDTANIFLSNGSINETSKTLFCHRNTTAKRLDQIEALTGLDLRKPIDAATYLLAFSTITDYSSK